MFKTGKPKKSVSKSPKSAEPVDLSTSLDDEEVVTMATVRSLLAVQESMLKTLFESVVNGINARMDDLEKSVSDIKASLEFSQTEIEDLKPLRPKLKEAEENLIRVHNSMEYLENQSRRNNMFLVFLNPLASGKRSMNNCALRFAAKT